MPSFNNKRIVGIIPSRLKSSRVKNKPLVDILGLPMIVHVYKRACLSASLDDVYVATDSLEIFDLIEKYGGKAIMTSIEHKNGTERLAEAVKGINCDYAVLINGDEAIFNPEHIQTSIDTLINSDADASLLALKFKKEHSSGDFKIVLNAKSEVMYISRNDIPSSARNKVDFRLKAYHIMTFKKESLFEYAKLEKSPLEKIEDHEHLRMIENGLKIKVSIVESNSVSVDTQDDLDYVRDKMLNDPYFKKYAK